jgi:hypothetical protein
MRLLWSRLLKHQAKEPAKLEARLLSGTSNFLVAKLTIVE